MQSSLLVAQRFLDIQKLNLENLKFQQRLLGLVWKLERHVELLIHREDLIGETSHHFRSKGLTVQLSTFLTLTFVQIRHANRELEGHVLIRILHDSERVFGILDQGRASPLKLIRQNLSILRIARWLHIEHHISNLTRNPEHLRFLHSPVVVV